MRQKTELRLYQNRIADHLYAHDEALCVVRPGAGKTISALTAIEELIAEGHIRHALVVAPKRVARAVWPDEIAAWAHIAGLRYCVLAGTPADRLAMPTNRTRSRSHHCRHRRGAEAGRGAEQVTRQPPAV